MRRGEFLVLVVVLLAFARAISAPLNADAAWMLYLADGVLEHESLYSDLVELNPPLMVWLLLPVAAGARVLNVPGEIVFFITLLAVCIWTMSTLWRLLLEHATRAVAEVVTLGALLALVAVPGGDFGEREHFGLALILPSIVILGIRHAGGTPPARTALVAGLAAAVGISLKPFLIFGWLLPVAAVCAVRGIRTTLRLPEVQAVPALGLLYILLVHFITPQYWEIVRIYGPTYAEFGMRSVSEVIWQLPVVLLAVGGITWRLLAKYSSQTSLSLTLLLGALGFFIGVLVQHKGWTYHFIPVTGTALILLLLLASLSVGQYLPARVARLSAAGWTAATLVLIAGGEPLSNRHSAWRVDSGQLAITKTAIEKYPQARSLLVLSSQLFDAFPLVHEVGLAWTSSFPSLWFLQVLYPNGDASGFTSPSRMNAIERDAWGRLVRDFRERPPDLLFVESRAANAARLGTRGIGFISYLRMDSSAATLLDSYRLVDSVGPLVMWARDEAMVSR